MKIAITGGAGFVGSHIASAYLDAGHDVFIIDSLVAGSAQAIDSRARFYQLDIRDSKLEMILRNERPDILSHHAAQRQYGPFPLGQSPLTDADIHIRGLLNVLDSCVNAHVTKIIFASAGNSLYGQIDMAECLADVTLIKEDAPLCPRRPFDISKVAGESYVRYYTLNYGLKHTILRYADIYGETHSELAQHPLTYFIAMLAENRRPVIRGSGNEIRDHIFIDDVVRANLSVLERGKNATLHISSGHGYTLNQFYVAAARLLESDLLPVYVSGPLTEPPAIALDNTLAQKLLGWQPRISFSEGVRLAVERLGGAGADVQPDVVAIPIESTAERRAALALA
ncbi:MAG TPA: NAD-dependent epimerase/dehydratase family protein [Ktedonobacteraceae bacterium]|jgi:UDP-glucose 4-epimerase|nr:NAD-dependent epimerase/dehydratase family protein [Ktedonobacteraceae bacterium]